MFNPFSPQNPTHTEGNIMSTKHTPSNRSPWYKTKKGAIAGIAGALLLFSACNSVAGEDDTQQATQTAEQTTQQTTQETAQEEAVQATPEEINYDFTQWWVGRYDATSWKGIAENIPGRWEGHVVSTAVNQKGDSLIIVTRLSGENTQGQALADNAVVNIQNASSLAFADQVPASVSDNLKYITVLDLQNNVLASGGVEFPNAS